MVTILSPVVYPGRDALVVENLLKLACAVRTFIFPASLTYADDNLTPGVHVQVIVVPRHVGHIVCGRVVVDILVAIAIEKVVCMVQSAESYTTLEAVWSAHHEVYGMCGSQAATCHIEHLIVALLYIGKQFIGDIVEPLFLKP